MSRPFFEHYIYVVLSPLRPLELETSSETSKLRKGMNDHTGLERPDLRRKIFYLYEWYGWSPSTTLDYSIVFGKHVLEVCHQCITLN